VRVRTLSLNLLRGAHCVAILTVPLPVCAEDEEDEDASLGRQQQQQVRDSARLSAIFVLLVLMILNRFAGCLGSQVRGALPELDQHDDVGCLCCEPRSAPVLLAFGLSLVLFPGFQAVSWLQAGHRAGRIVRLRNWYARSYHNGLHATRARFASIFRQNVAPRALCVQRHLPAAAQRHQVFHAHGQGLLQGPLLKLVHTASPASWC
jgi:hypothetical protein